MENNFEVLRSFFGRTQDPDADENHSVVVSPLSIAVTGHRLIDEELKSDVKCKIRDFLEETVRVWERKTWKARLRKDTVEQKIPILVLTGMAEGGDQWVAETVLEIKEKNPDSPLRLISVLPMPLDDYLTTFSDIAEDGTLPREELPKFLEKSDCVITLDLTKESVQLKKEIGELEEQLNTSISDEEKRALAKEIKEKNREYHKNQFCALGEYLVSHGYIILALWNGVNDITYDSKFTEYQHGGTEDVIRMKMEGTPVYSLFSGEPFADMTIQPFGSVYQIVVPKSSKGQNKSSSVLSVNHRSFNAPNVAWQGVVEKNVLKTFMLEPKACEKKDFEAYSWTDNVAICPMTPYWFYAKSISVQVWRFLCQTDLMTGKLFSDMWTDFRHKPRRQEYEFMRYYPTTNTGVSLDIMKNLNLDILKFQKEIEEQFDTTERYLLPLEKKKTPEKKPVFIVRWFKSFLSFVVCIYRWISRLIKRKELEVRDDSNPAPEINPDIAEFRKTANYPFLFRVYATFDQLAAIFQKRFQKAAFFFMFLMFVAAVAASFELQFVFYGVYVFLLFLCAFERCYLKYYAKYRRYRVVAEVLRIQIFWDQAKIGISIIDSYRSHQISELNWLRMTLKSFMVPLEKQELFNPEFVKQYWLKGQYEYFRKKLGVKRRADSWCRVMGVILILLGAIWYGQTGLSKVYLKQFAVNISADNQNNPREGENGTQPKSNEIAKALEHYAFWFRILSLGLPLGTIVIFYNRVKGFRHEANNYAKILPIFHQALSSMRQMKLEEDYPNERELKMMFLSLAEQAMSENVDWHLLPNELKFTKD